ncbi:unnamed protein product [Spirodela intermedia]|uniref:HTH La-type RNA-binding domain-containing protein n=1 Tax=Spirodela intermedia TaxID=51605 RepID=A0A7I8JCA9_SPIIN|nr:unnamed protein product [Spirodela intermedia]CAA6667759.1 unnamed protein product [Spirodela intermedia]
MADENPEQSQADELPEGREVASSSGDQASDSAEPSLSRLVSLSRLNAQAPEFVPRTPPAGHSSGRMDPRMVQIHPAPPPLPVMRIFQPPPPPRSIIFPPYRISSSIMVVVEGGIGSRRWVEYYFSDINLATTEHLMRFINKDPEGFVPISVIAGFKKIKALVSNNAQLAGALRTSSKLVVSDDGKKVRRQQPFTDADLEELQSRIVVAENLPEDHCYQNLVRVFSVVGSVKTIRTCYPQTTNGERLQFLSLARWTCFLETRYFLHKYIGNHFFSLQLHAFVEYGTFEEAEKAVAELNDEKNWRSGLRLRLLPRCMTKYGLNRARKGGSEGEGVGEDEDTSMSNQQHHDRHFEDPSQSGEASHEHMGDDGYHERDGGGGRRGRGRGRGFRGRGGRGQPNTGGAASHLPAPAGELLPGAAKQPVGPRMPDGTRGFGMGRGRKLPPPDRITCRGRRRRFPTFGLNL